MDVGFRLLAVLALVLANGFFVAAEFSLVTVRKTRIDQLIAEGSRMARPVRRALNQPDRFRVTCADLKGIYQIIAKFRKV